MLRCCCLSLGFQVVTHTEPSKVGTSCLWWWHWKPCACWATRRPPCHPSWYLLSLPSGCSDCSLPTHRPRHALRHPSTGNVGHRTPGTSIYGAQWQPQRQGDPQIEEHGGISLLCYTCSRAVDALDGGFTVSMWKASPSSYRNTLSVEFLAAV